jgi:phage terminase small subunit
MAKLTDKQALFIAEYMVDKNATQAAIRAGYSEDTAQQIGSENLSKPVIQKEIERRINDQIKRLSITSDRVINKISAIANSKTATNSDRLKALQMLGENQKLFTQKHEIGDFDGKPLPPPNITIQRVVMNKPEGAPDA